MTKYANYLISYAQYNNMLCRNAFYRRNYIRINWGKFGKPFYQCFIGLLVFTFCPCVTLFDTWVEMTGQTLLKDFLLCTFLCCAYLTWLTGFLCFNGSFKVKKVSGSLYPVDSLVCLSLPRSWGKLRHKTTFFKTIIFSLPFVLDMFW